MTKWIANILLFAIIGLVMGYFIFARTSSGFIPPNQLIFNPQGMLEKFSFAMKNITAMRQNILLCGAGGAVVGLLISLFLSKKKA